MFGEKVYLTREGHDKLIKELKLLKGVKRREIAENIDEARQLGDLSENAEYDAAREAQAFNEKRISELENALSNFQIIENLDISDAEVRVGAKVELKNLNSDEIVNYQILSEFEADIDSNKISISSPIAKALLGHKEHDVVEVKLSNRTVKYKILDISR